MKALLRGIEIFFWCAAIVLLGAYALIYLDRGAYQAYENWRFDRELQHQPAPVAGFLLHALHFGGAAHPLGAKPADVPQPEPPAPPPEPPAPQPEPAPAVQPVSRSPIRPLHPGSLIGRIEIPRLGIRAMVAESTESSVLRRAVGHIEGTALPGQPGNVGLAGHRDTLFRALRHVRKGDLIVLRTLEGTYRYRVASTRIVEPSNVEVLNATAQPTLTLVTCYPFYYVGSAPHRFIVRAPEVLPAGAAPTAAALVGPTQ